jgi:stalled ribosome rescue protein Dom34
MKSKVGLWIDHKRAFIVVLGDGGRLIDSDMEKNVRYSGHSHAEDGVAEDQRDRQFVTHLDRYYDEVISYIDEADSILILGPGEAKSELKNRLKRKHLDNHIVDVETVGKMTYAEIAEKTRAYFHM